MLAACMRDADEPQTVQGIARGYFGDSSRAPDEGSIHNWLRFGARFGVLDCDWSKSSRTGCPILLLGPST